jgi:cytochrome b
MSHCGARVRPERRTDAGDVPERARFAVWLRSAPRPSSPAMPEPTAALGPIRVWDLPTRLFHWLLAVAIVCSVVTGRIGGEALQWHFRSGYLIFTLLVFRVVWGLVGGRWSRFTSFVYAPGTLLRYLRGRGRAEEHLDVGHSPLGSLSVLALIGFLVVQVATGLIADDEIASTGPLNRFVSTATGLAATAWHKNVGQWALIALVALHLLAIAWYARRGRSLVRPMWSGDKQLPVATPAATDSAGTRVLAAVLGALAALLVGWVVSLGG